MSKTILPNFDLAKLTSYQSSSFSRPSPLDKDARNFMFAMAVAFNDLKDYYWLYQITEDNIPKDQGIINAEVGQWSGMRVFCIRKILATFYELIDLVKKEGVHTRHSDFQKSILQLGPVAKKAWDNIVYMALSKPATLSTKERAAYNVILFVRHNITSHYYGLDNFGKGFELHSKTKPNDLYASFGLNMEQTRFFFGDAICQQYIEDVCTRNKITLKEVIKVVKRMNEACRMLLEAYLKIASGQLKLNRSSKRKLGKK